MDTSRYPNLLEPFRLRGVTFKNRLMSMSHAPGYVEDRHPKLRYQLYHEEKAKGGLALTMFGGSSNVAPDSPSAFGQIYIGDDSIVPVLREFSERVHRHGCALMCQITHMGHRTLWNVEDWLPPVAPSPVREHAHRSFPKEMDRSDIRRVVRAFGDAAARCREGGLDGVELLAYGHLIHQFWTPLVNRRTDEYGDHQGPSVADFLASNGSAVELVTPDRMTAHEVGATNYPVYLASFYSKGVTLTPDRRLLSVERDGNRLRARLRNEYSDAEEVRMVDQVVVEHGTLPAAELFHELGPLARNEGDLDLGALIAGRPQAVASNPDGEFMLFRVGDAVASRNVHAAIYDSLRLCKAL